MNEKKLLNGVKVIRMPTKKMYGYVGMNKDAAQSMGYPWHYGNNTILLAETEHGIEAKKTKIHEIVEKHFMDKGLPYWKAHKKASEAEKVVR